MEVSRGEGQSTNNERTDEVPVSDEELGRESDAIKDVCVHVECEIVSAVREEAGRNDR